METIQIIQSVEDSGLKADLLSAISILAGEKYPKELVKKYIRREQLMQSALFEEWVAEFVDEAEEKARREFAIKMIKRNRPTQEIIEDTGLTQEEIQKIKVELKP